MNSHTLARVVGLAVVIAAAPADASLLTSIDILDPSGALVTDGATRDGMSELDWLDVTLTLNLSVNDVFGGAGPGAGWVSDGWRYATTAEMCELFGALGDPISNCPSASVGTGDSIAAASATTFISLLGNTASIGPEVFGFFDDGSIVGPPNSTFVGIGCITGDGVVGCFEVNSATAVEDIVITTGFSDPNIGSFLVRPFVPAVPADCDDGVDNDSDGFFDFPGDPGCFSADDFSERSATLPCDDGVDNDGDGRTDYDPVTLANPGDQNTDPAGQGDPGCLGTNGPREDPQCQNGIDDDGQLGTDYDGGRSINGTAVSVDPQCVDLPYLNRERRPKPLGSGCGLGAEVAFMLPLLAWLYGRNRRQSSLAV